MFKLLQNYTDCSTTHSVKYIGRKNFSVKERLFWLCAFLTFLGLASSIGLTLWTKFSSTPTEIIVNDVHYPLYKIPFPAVTICPANQINFTEGKAYLARYFKTQNKDNENIITEVLNILTLMKYPSYFNMEKHLRSITRHLKYFDNLNITDLVLSTLPSCSELMKECLWHGERIHCCEIFLLQRTEQGFCYSFNSLTAEKKKNCKLINVFNNPIYTGKQMCKPQHITSSGKYTGLTVVMNKIPAEQGMYPNGVYVLLSPTYEYPEAGRGTLLETNPGETLEIEATPVLTEGSSKLIRYPIEERGCSLDSENVIKLLKYYSMNNCLLECRHNFVVKHCKCQPYFFYDSNIDSPECTLRQLNCLVKYAGKIRLKPPSKLSLTLAKYNKYPNCSCIVPCNTINYDLVIKRSNLTFFGNDTPNGILDVYFSSLGAIKYLKKMSFSQEQLVVSIGGVGNLFLGASIIGMTEPIYFFLRGSYTLLRIRLRNYYSKLKRSRISYVN